MHKKLQAIILVCLSLSVYSFNYIKINSNVERGLKLNFQSGIPSFKHAEEDYREESFFSPSTINNDWNRTKDSIFNRQFKIKNAVNQTTSEISLTNCSSWDVESHFNFTNLRTEKIINGDAETNQSLWMDYLPENYEGNVTREDSPPIGQPISGIYSWYFDIQSENHTTIVGFDDPINVSGDSVIFSFSYSLLRNNLVTNYDSNILIRLFFQFDVYIFIWFNGDTSVLSNVTGPGGYVDLLVNEATFDGGIHTYSLNITALGLEMFNQKPDQLRSFAVQTWGELPYQMDFMLDDISLTDLVSPSDVDLKINNYEVSGNLGKGFVTLSNHGTNTINYIITSNASNMLLWDCYYEISGFGTSLTYRYCNFESWQDVLWKEFYNKTITYPIEAVTLQISKWVPIDWAIDSIYIDGDLITFEAGLTNSTHKEIVFSANSIHYLEMHFYSENLITNLLLQNYQLSHDELLTANIESYIYNQEIAFYIFNPKNDLIYSAKNFTNSFGKALFSGISFRSDMPKGVYTVITFWSFNDKTGIGKTTFEILTYPTSINTKKSITINYKQDLFIEIDYINVETSVPIDFASVEYSWDFGSGKLQQNIDKKYSVKITSLSVSPGIYPLAIVSSREGFATSSTIIMIEIVFNNFQLSLHAPQSMVPGGTIQAVSQVLDNNSLPVSEIKVRFKINNNLVLETWSNDSGFAVMYYFLAPDYLFTTLNLSSSVIIDETEYLASNTTIIIDLSSAPRRALLSKPVQVHANNDTVLFKFQISYPTIGNTWYINTPIGFNPTSAFVQSATKNLSVTISEFGVILWNKEVTNSTMENDLLFLEIPSPQPQISLKNEKQSFSITIEIITNGVPYTGLEVKIPRTSESLNFIKWDLFLNESLVTTSCDLKINNDFFSFKITSTEEVYQLTFKLIGSKLPLNGVPFTSIFLGLGILLLTSVSIFLLVKRKKDNTFDIIQV